MLFEAIFKNGVLRPLEPIGLAENEQVQVTVSRLAEEDWLDSEYSDACRAESDSSVTLAQVRAALAKIPGTMDEAIDKDRGDY